MGDWSAANTVYAWLLVEKGENEIIVLDLKGPQKAEVTGLSKPILDMLRPEGSMTHRKSGENLNLKREKPVVVGQFKAGNGWQQVTFDQTVEGRYFCLEALDSHDENEIASVAELYLLDENGEKISRQHWKIVYADSESTSWGNFTADKVFDLQESTYWSTVDGVKFPHAIVVDLGKKRKIKGVSYIPRAEEKAPGAIRSFKVYVKEDPFRIK